MAWYWWALAGVGAVAFLMGGLLVSLPIRFYRGFISRKVLARLPDAASVDTAVDIRCSARISMAKLARIDPWMIGRDAALRGLETSLRHGAGEPAVVVATSPLCVSCFSDDFDAVLVLRFDESFVPPAPLALGDELLCVTTFFWAQVRPALRPVAPDILPGQKYTNWFDNFAPFIVDFLSDDAEEIERCKQQISEQQWQRTFDLGYERLKSGARPRDGRPSLCHRPTQPWKWLWRLCASMAAEDVKPMPANGSWGNEPRRLRN